MHQTIPEGMGPWPLLDDDEKFWGEFKTKQNFFETIRNRNKINILKGVDECWWESVDKRGNPVPFPIVVKIFELPEKAIMAHVMAHEKVRAFKSVNSARKNGWNKPLQIGLHKVKREGIPQIVKLEN